MGPDKIHKVEMIDRERCRLDLLSKGLRTGKPYWEHGIKLHRSSTDSQGARVRRKLLAKSCLFKKRSMGLSVLQRGAVATRS